VATRFPGPVRFLLLPKILPHSENLPDWVGQRTGLFTVYAHVLAHAGRGGPPGAAHDAVNILLRKRPIVSAPRFVYIDLLEKTLRA